MLKKGLIAGVAIYIVGFIFNFGGQRVFPQIGAEYKAGVFRPFSDPLMMIYFLYPFILGFVLFYLWNLLEKQLSGKPTDKALRFAKIYFAVATIPGMFISYTSIQLSLTMVIVWTITGFLQAFVAGLVFAKVK